MSIRTKLFHFWFLLSRPMTLGVRAVATNSKREILLVRHTYIKGWHFPGGGVDRGENCDSAVMRELLEETGISTKQTPKLFGLYFNKAASVRDHVAVYLVENVADTITKKPDREIADVRFFPLDNLPTDINSATLARLDEIFEGAERSAYW